MSGGDAVTAAFQRLTHAGYVAAPIKATNEFENAPLSWTLNGFSMAQPRLNSDDSLTLTFRPLNSGNSYKETQRVPRGGVLAVRQKGQPQITFIKVDY